MKLQKRHGSLIFPILLTGFLLSGCVATRQAYHYRKMTNDEKQVYNAMEKLLNQADSGKTPFLLPERVRIDSVNVDKMDRTIGIYMSPNMGSIPYRFKNTREIYDRLRYNLEPHFHHYSITIFTLKKPVALQSLIPNYYRSSPLNYDTLRMPPPDAVYPVPVVRDASRPYRPVEGLLNHTVALWPSHGWYYSNERNRWEWQRPRLFQTVEDKLPLSFTLLYLVPMLENAGANVFVARERDTQSEEVVVDNDSSDAGSKYIEHINTGHYRWAGGDTSGFAIGNPPYRNGENPFRMGTYRRIEADVAPTAGARWVPDIPRTGKYAVCVSYHQSADNVTDAHYKVFHQGGETDFRVNQRIGGGTWIYLGTFKFRKGIHPDSGSVVLTNQTAETGAFVTADAVRFGGGMGDIVRGGRTSGRPRYLEAARYYLQYAGMPDTLVYDLNDGKNDYEDDYKDRGEWVNYLHGAPDGPNRDRDAKGLGIPVDLSLAFHTDAGIAPEDSAIGTLAIYSYPDVDTTYHFPDGRSRLASRDFADILQTQVVHDIRSEFDRSWPRRPLEDAMYSEVARPNVPSALLELLSHQNFTDTRLAMDPRFQFAVSRAIYKAMLRFIATEYREPYVVQPLPVNHMQTRFLNDTTARISWRPVRDTLEASAVPTGYIVYTRKGNAGFDNGHLVKDTTYIARNLQPGQIYSFKVAAVNAGGKSFPSEILSVCHMPGKDKPVLIINGFDRVSAPASISTRHYDGFVNFRDKGVADGYGIDYTGSQYNFDRDSPYRSNDQPGNGASHSNAETRLIPGNTHDYPYVYGKSLKNNGFSFVSCSNEAVMDGQVSMNDYPLVMLILGEQKRTIAYPLQADSTQKMTFLAFPPKLQKDITDYCNHGGKLFISGAYVASDLFNKDATRQDTLFAENVLKYQLDTNWADLAGAVMSADPAFMSFADTLHYNTGYRPDIYQVEAPDALIPAADGGEVLLRYAQNQFSAAVGYRGTYSVFTMGFPFETVGSQSQRDYLMKMILNYLNFTIIRRPPPLGKAG